MRWRDETGVTDVLRAEIESMTGGKVTLAGEITVGRGKTRATLRSGAPVLLSVTVRGDAVAALIMLRERAASG